GQIGLSGSNDGTLIVWDLTSGQRKHLLQSHQAGVVVCAVSGDGLTAISASSLTPLVIVWDLATGHQRYRLAGHEDQIGALAVNADGRVGLSASRDGALLLWDLAKGKERRRDGGADRWRSYLRQNPRRRRCVTGGPGAGSGFDRTAGP